ncbi:HNH endonuclease signature motif containing protein [Geodermatophilus sp. SYSU D00708]
MAAPTGEVDGQPITAAHLRELLAQLDAVCPGGLQPLTGGTLTVALTDAAGGLLATTTRAELQRLARRGCPTHPDGKCGYPLLGRPAATDGYAPTAAQRRWLQARDHTCRHPGCATTAGRADLDHVTPHGCGGQTSCENLCCLCRRHHRLKTFARGWTHALTPDGVLSVTPPAPSPAPADHRAPTGPHCPSPDPASWPNPHHSHRRPTRTTTHRPSDPTPACPTASTPARRGLPARDRTGRTLWSRGRRSPSTMQVDAGERGVVGRA